MQGGNDGVQNRAIAYARNHGRSLGFGDEGARDQI
jgi:hypothetical protein